MANSSNLLTGINTLTADHMSDTAVDVTYPIQPTVSFLLNMNQTGVKKGFQGIGRPDSKGVLVGAGAVSAPNKETVLNTTVYRPFEIVGYPSTSINTIIGATGNVPLMPNADTDTTESYAARPFFKYTEQATPLLVWKKSIAETKQSTKGENPDVRKAVGNLFTMEVTQKTKTHALGWNDMFWTAANAPSNVDSRYWSSQYSFSSALDDDNSYAGVDRSLSANAYFRAQRPTAQQPASLIHLANFVRFDPTYGIHKWGNNGPMLFVAGLSLFSQFLNEARQKGAGTVITSDSIPDMPQHGFQKTTLIKVDDYAYCICDPSTPTNGVSGATKSVVMALTPKTWTVAIRPEKNYSVDEWFDLTQTEGGKDAYKSQIRTELLVACEAPRLNFWFEDVA